jgi:putative membrane protein
MNHALRRALMTESRQHFVLLASFLAILLWSGIAPKDHFIWFLEVFPAMAAAVVLAVIYPRIRLTMLLYCLIWLHALVLMLGGHWTYAEMPLFSWLRDEFGLARNYYDRVGHFFQGFVPAMIAREIFLRNRIVNGRGWMFFLVCCVALAISAFYELIEWWVAVASGTAADDFLATQGDVWDTQWDMFIALCGAIVAQITLAGWHDRQLKSHTGSH